LSASDTNENQCLSGGIQKAGEIFAMHGDFIRSIIAFNIQDKDIVEDLVQDFFLYIASRNISEEVSNMRGYLFKMATNHVTDSVRKMDSYKSKIRKYAKRIKNEVIHCDKERTAETEEVNKAIALIEKKLSKRDATAMKLLYQENLDYDEAAKKMSLKPLSVRRYVARGLKIISKAFNDEQGGSKC
jgi:RNA polymerase sigma factor (sigma-70 family)